MDEALENEKFEELVQKVTQIKTLKEVANEESLEEGINLKEARDILWAFIGRDIYRLLVIDKEWTSDEYEKWLAHSLIKIIAK